MNPKQSMAMGFLVAIAIFSSAAFLFALSGNSSFSFNLKTAKGSGNAGEHFLGKANAKVTLVEYSDVQCPFCQRFHPTVKQLLQEYPNDVKWVYKHFPLNSIHPQAQSGAEAAECVADQLGNEGFFAYLDQLFNNQSALGRSLYISKAVEVGANEAEFTKCFDEGKFRDKVLADLQEGQAAGVTGTPSSFINGQNLSGAVSYEQVKAVVESNL